MISTDYLPAAVQALEGFTNKVLRNEDLYICTPITFLMQINTLGSDHPSLHADLTKLLQPLHAKHIVQGPIAVTTPELASGIYFLQKFLRNLMDGATDDEVLEMQQYLEKNDPSKTAEFALDILLQNEEGCLDSPESFIDQVKNLEAAKVLTFLQTKEILSLVNGEIISSSITNEPLKTAFNRKVNRLKEMAKKIYDHGKSLIVVSEKARKELILETEKKVREIHEEYKRTLLSKTSYASRVSSYYYNSIPITDIDTSAFIALLAPTGDDLDPPDPTQIPNLFKTDVLTENDYGKTRAFNHVYIFTKHNAPHVVISRPQSREDALEVMEQATLFAKRILSPTSTERKVFRMRNYILDMCTQHIGNMLVGALLVPMNYELYNKNHRAMVSISTETAIFDVIMKDGVLQKNQFKVSYEALLTLKVSLENASDQEKDIVQEHCLSLLPFAKATSEFILQMKGDKESRKWTPSITSLSLDYSLTSSL